MAEKIAVKLGDVQKTLFLPLWGRAFESTKKAPLLVDKTAVEIINNVDYDFSIIANKMNELSQMAWIMRSLCIDQAIKNFLVTHPKATIVNIGCGMDTTFERVDNHLLLWYDLDLPDVIGLRKNFIHENERRRFIASSFLESEWFEEIKAEDGILFIAAGVFYYFEEAQIKDFLIRLTDRFPNSQILFDVSSPYGVKVANRAVIRNSGLDERSFLKWGLESDDAIATWDKRLHIVATYYYFKGQKKTQSLRYKLLGWLSDRLRVQYMIQLALTE